LRKIQVNNNKRDKAVIQQKLKQKKTKNSIEYDWMKVSKFLFLDSTNSSDDTHSQS